MAHEPYDQIVRQYIERVTALRDQRRELPDAKMLQAIAQDLGMTQADLMAAEEAAQLSTQRGLGYLRHQRWDDAIAEFTNAVALQPTQVETLHGLALAYKERWTTQHKVADQQEAIRLTKQCLELDPNHEASFALLNDLDRPLPPARRTKSNRGWRYPALIGVTTVLVIAGLISYLTVKPSEPSDGTTAPTIESVTTSDATEQPDEVEVPVQFVESEQISGLRFSVRESNYATYGSNFHTLVADIQNQSQFELQELKFKVEFLDASGQVFRTAFQTGISSSDAPMRPGDAVGVEWLEENAGEAHAVRVSVQTLKQSPAATTYSPAKVLPARWLSQRPTEMNLEVRERFSQFEAYDSGSAYHTLTLEVENTGQVALETVQVLVETLDAGDRVLSSDEYYIITGSDASLLPGQTRVRSFVTSTTPAFQRYRVAIVNVK
ncbi:hypothetical protein H6G89_12885 [Oscillatoria sp. FACHB-1407]|uniref:tetratricopeptide repeat protein n=1 Tax=Oscillatoria sp. FACHB-1407 TaxID=2692847 RepID=UPI0016844C5E|nr:hypothetical protein [Oscillatoria sp. FACHB-1407]MBD2461942.1 hypothetical protein [Oscillatoria sp. FACHB-1407]